MKKTIVALLCAMLCMCLMIPAFAEEATPSATLSADKTTLNPGDEVVFVVTLADCEKAASIAFGMQFDESVFELVIGEPVLDEDGEETGRYTTPAWILKNSWLGVTLDGIDLEKNNAALKFFAGTKDVNGERFTFTLRVKDTAAFGETNVEVTAKLENKDKDFFYPENNTLSLNIVCPHNNQSMIPAVEATCCETGLTVGYQCDDCGEIVTAQDEIPATGEHVDADGEWNHDEDGHFYVCYFGTEFGRVAHSGGHATCIAKAQCEVCGIEYGQVDSNEHGETEIRDDSVESCVVDGYTGDTYCLDCGEKIAEGEVISAPGHDDADAVEENRLEPTCAVDGSYDLVVYCSVCGEELIRDTIVISATGEHNFVETDRQEATCTEDGYVNYACGCGTAFDTEVLPMTGHSHEAAVTAPTCTEQGYTTYTCHCGDEYVDDYVDALGHTEVTTEENRVEPTCAVDGSYVQVVTCSVCGEELSRETIVIPATGEHIFVETDRQEATCTEDGYVNYACGCGTAFDTEVLPMTGHSHEAAVTAPTCTEQGYTTYTCHCGDEYVDDYVDALGHTEVTTEENRVEPTCAVDGSYVQVVTCSVCGEELSRETIVIPATGEHIYAEPGERVEPTCTEDGYYIMICGCGAEERTELPALGHEWVAANCTTPKTCSVCGATEGEPVPEAHDYGEWEIIVEAGNEEGLMRRWCAVCGGFDELVIPPNHTCSFRKLVIAPTCDSWGVDLYICTGCELSYTDNYKPALGHTFGEYVSNNDATCTEDGTKTAKCIRCDVTDTIADEGSAKGHGSFSVKFNSWPTCTEDADWDVFCEACGIQIADEEWQSWGTINGWKATGHKWVDATCTTPKTCTVCGETEGEMLAHTEEIIPGKAATCTEAGLTEGKKCSVCGEILVAQEEIAVLEHTEEIIPGKAATCTETGLTEGKKCSVCGEILVAQEEIAVLEHAGEWVVVKEAQIGEAGLKQLICTVCGEVIAEEEIPALEEPAPTSDSMILLFVISAMAAMTGAAVLVMKKKYF